MSSNESWELKVRDIVYKTLEKFPKKDRTRIVQVIEYLPRDPYKGDTEKMNGQPYTWRRRIGAYRIFYEIIVGGKIIYVFRAERRTSKTY